MIFYLGLYDVYLASSNRSELVCESIQAEIENRKLGLCYPTTRHQLFNDSVTDTRSKKTAFCIKGVLLDTNIESIISIIKSVLDSAIEGDLIPNFCVVCTDKSVTEMSLKLFGDNALNQNTEGFEARKIANLPDVYLSGNYGANSGFEEALAAVGLRISGNHGYSNKILSINKSIKMSVLDLLSVGGIQKVTDYLGNELDERAFVELKKPPELYIRHNKYTLIVEDVNGKNIPLNQLSFRNSVDNNHG